MTNPDNLGFTLIIVKLIFKGTKPYYESARGKNIIVWPQHQVKIYGQDKFSFKFKIEIHLWLLAVYYKDPKLESSNKDISEP